MIEELKYLISILISVILGFLIGYERKLRFKEAGIRTHTIVCAGSALIMVVSKYGFGDSVEADASRVAAQIVSGIGFLGVGIIIYRKQDRLETIYAVLDGLKNHPMTYDDEEVRQLIDCVVVESKDRIKVVFCGGLQVEQPLRQEDMDFLSEMGQIPVNI